MTDNNRKQKWLNTLLTENEVDEFYLVQTHYGINTNADFVRFLIRQEARRLASITTQAES